MRLEQKVSSLELSKRLKILGVKQESEFYWVENKRGVALGWNEIPVINYLSTEFKTSAFTVAELGEMLPPSYECEVDGVKYNVYLEMDKHPDQRPRGYRFRLRYRPTFNERFAGYHNNEYSADTEADARAKMLIYLIEQGIVKP